MKRVTSILMIQACLSLLAGAARAADFPPITDEERAITAVPGEPNAPAVVLFKKGEFLMAGYGLQGGGLSSSLRVQVRLKVLTEEGKSNGEISIWHSDSHRLRDFKGRTVLPDGRILPVSADAKFVRKTSRSRKTFTTAVAFPSVQVGAILDYQYEVRFDSIFYLEPWYFSESVPVRRSEVVFRTSPDLRVQVWSRAPQRVKLQSEPTNNVLGFSLRVWTENLPPVPDEPYGPPYTDLAAQMLLLPMSMAGAGFREPLLESWPKTCELIGTYHYEPFRRRDGTAASKARAIAAAVGKREKAMALYRFVRDGIETGAYEGVLVDPELSMDKVLSGGRADRAEKALLLQSMLKTAGVDSRLVWAADRTHGTLDPQLPNPAWFDTILVMVELDGKQVFLDSSDRALGFGQLRAGYGGSQALIFDKRKPELITLPETPYDQNLQRAEVDLALDEKGRLAGKGTLRLTGHHAWPRIDWQDDETAALKAWQDWLAARYREFQISDVKAVESADEGKVTVTWSLAEREEEVLGDEASVVPSAPLGPAAQPFVQPVANRRTGVVFDYPDREEVELRLSWPEGWKVETKPRDSTLANAAGALSLAVEMPEGGRSLVYRRRLDITRREFGTTEQYEAIRGLFGETEKSDAQTFVLVHR